MSNLTKNLLIGAAAGLAAAWLKSKVEPPLQEIGEKAFPPKAEELNLKGADIIRQPENMPPAILADSVYEIATGELLPRPQKLKALKCIHYVTGAGVGAIYVATINPVKFLQKDSGATAGALIWGLSHGYSLPALGLQDDIHKMPKSWWVWELGSHLLYGIALEQSRKVLTALFSSSKNKKDISTKEHTK